MRYTFGYFIYVKWVEKPFFLLKIIPFIGVSIPFLVISAKNSGIRGVFSGKQDIN